MGVIAITTLQGCGRGEGQSNLLLITLDTTRYDRLGCTGYAAARTPALDGLAEKGALFEQVRSCIPITLPSHATILTGLTPPEHGVRYNGESALPDSIPTLATILKAEGYSTGAVLASPVLEAVYGLNRGFDHYDDRVLDECNPETGERLRSTERYRSASRIADLSLEWLATLLKAGPKNKPWFLWAHFYDPHYPRQFHEKLFGDQFEDDYDAEVAYMDHQIARILDYLDKKKLARRTLVVAVGDHGEGLGDHGESTHGFFIYDSTQRVPLIMRLPGRIEAGRRVSAQRSLADLMPSILQIMDVKSFAGTESADAIMARAFGDKLIKGAGIESGPCYMETLWTKSAFNWSPLFGVVDGGSKFIKSTRCELYDLESDPGEKLNLLGNGSSGDNIRRADELDALLDEMKSKMSTPQTVQVKLSAEQIRSLNSLGYTAGGGSAESTGSTNDLALPDVKDMKELIPIYTEVKVRVRREPEAPDLLEKAFRLVQGSPDTAIFHSYYARALIAAGCGAEAVVEYQEALKLCPEKISYHNNLANVLVGLGREREALSHLEMALSLNESRDELNERALARMKKNLQHLRKVCAQAVNDE